MTVVAIIGKTFFRVMRDEFVTAALITTMIHDPGIHGQLSPFIKRCTRADERWGKHVTLSQHDSIERRTPAWAIIIPLVCIAAIFSGELISLNRISGWWFDDLFSLWASDRTLPFILAFKERIITDSNPPLYFSLLYFVRLFISDDGAAVLILNIGVIIAAAAAVYLPSRKVGLSGWALAGIAAFVLSGPVLYFAPEGRSYPMALAIVFVASWHAALAINGFPEQFTLARAAIIGCLAALTHVYAALFCGSLAAGLLVLALFYGRRELLKPALALGLAASTVFAIWLGIAFKAIGRIEWIEFSLRNVLNAALSVKELAIGSNLTTVIVIGLFLFGLFSVSTRFLFIGFSVAFLLFAALPVITSFAQPIITNRYWLIGAAALPVVVLFAGKIWITDGQSPLRRERLAAGVTTLAFLVSSTVLGFVNARHYMPTKPFWTGGNLVRPLLAHCRGATVHVYYENMSKPYVSRPWAMSGFQKLTGVSPAMFVDARDPSVHYLSAANSSCRVLGWTEHAWDWQEMNDSDLLKLLKIQALPREVEIFRSESGFVILKRDPRHRAKPEHHQQADSSVSQSSSNG